MISWTPSTRSVRGGTLSVAILFGAVWLPAVAGTTNDDCQNAISVIAGIYEGDTVAATRDGSASCGNSGATADVWYRYTALVDGVLTAETCAAVGYDTVLSVHSDCPGDTANELVCDDDSCAPRSRIETAVTAGDTYYIRVSGSGPARGFFDLAINDDTAPFDSACDASWDEAFDGDPPASRYGHDMVYDRGRETIVMFGGAQGIELELQDTWEWKDGDWSRVASVGPSRRVFHAMAYDDDRGVTVMFGGTQDDFFVGPFRDTWEWDGRSWTRVADSGPPQRESHAMVYDPVRKVVVMFGGYNLDGTLNDTWEWDGTTWTQRFPFGGIPSPREDHAMAYDPVRGVVVLYGGLGGLRDTWQWDGTSWTRVDNAGPIRTGHVLGFDEARGTVILFGGRESTFGPALDETWEWDGSRWARVSTEGPPARAEAALAFDGRSGELILFGGDTSFFVGGQDTWSWDGSRWNELASAVGPTPRRNFAIAYDSARQATLISGGSVNGETFADTWQWDGTLWQLLSTSGPPPGGDAMAYDSARDVTVLHVDGTTWELTGSLWSPITSTGPSERDGHAMVYDVVRGVTLLFGGRSGFTEFDDLWAWDGSVWTLLASGGPAPRCEHAMAYDAIRGKTVMFGGWNGLDRYADTWEWDGSSWALRPTAAQPRARGDHAMTYDVRRQKVVLVGGSNSLDIFGDTWEWDGESWRQITAGGPDDRFGTGLAYDTVRGTAVLFGGTLSGIVDAGDTWEYDGPLGLSVAALVPGEPAELDIVGAEPGETVHVLRSSAGEGDGPCPPQIGGRCLGILAPVALLGQAISDASCAATLTFDLPPTVPSPELSMQAVAVRGAGGIDSILSDAVTAPFVVPSPVDVSLSHTAVVGDDWLWGYRLVNSTPDPIGVELTAVQLRPDGSEVVLEGPLEIVVEAFGGVDETRALFLGADQPAGDHRVEVAIVEPIAGVLLDEGSTRVHLQADGGEAAPSDPGESDRPDGRSRGGAPNLTVNARVEQGSSWEYRYELTNASDELVEVRAEMFLTDPSGRLEIIAGPTSHELVPDGTLPIVGSHLLDVDAELGSYTSFVRLSSPSGAPLVDSAEVRFSLIEP